MNPVIFAHLLRILALVLICYIVETLAITSIFPSPHVAKPTSIVQDLWIWC